MIIPGYNSTDWDNPSSGITASFGKIIPSITTSGWNKGASFGSIPINDGFLLEFNPVFMPGQVDNGHAMIGVGTTDPNYNYTSINYAIYLTPGLAYIVYENGVSQGQKTIWTTADTLGISRTGTTIDYLKNGDVVFTSSIASSAAMLVDSSIYRHVGFENIKLMY
jgi:hypothetical protein